jgi:hypothetical protein
VTNDLTRSVHPDQRRNVQDFERLATALKALRETHIITPEEARAILRRYGWIDDVKVKALK